MLKAKKSVVFIGIDLSPNKLAMMIIDQNKEVKDYLYLRNSNYTKNKIKIEKIDKITKDSKFENFYELPSKENVSHLYIKADLFAKEAIIILNKYRENGSDVQILIEGYSHASFNRGDDVRELTGIFLYNLIANNYSFNKIAPQSLKAKFVGFAGDSKIPVGNRVQEILGYKFQNDDLDDAFALAYLMNTGDIFPNKKPKKKLA